MDTLAMNEIAQPAVGLHGWEDIPAMARSTSPAARDRTTPGGTPLQTSPQIALGGRLAAPRGSAHRPISPDRGQDKGAAGETSRELRARFVDHLGPVQVTLRQDGAALQLTARVALASAPAASLLERRLREAVSQEGHALSRLQINGQVRPAEAGA